jgi:hypothetical protein
MTRRREFKFVHIFINNYILCRSNFSYTFRPADILREKSDTKEYIFLCKMSPRRALVKLNLQCQLVKRS